jgi:hypothetical protein
MRNILYLAIAGLLLGCATPKTVYEPIRAGKNIGPPKDLVRIIQTNQSTQTRSLDFANLNVWIEEKERETPEYRAKKRKEHEIYLRKRQLIYSLKPIEEMTSAELIDYKKNTEELENLLKIE